MTAPKSYKYLTQETNFWSLYKKISKIKTQKDNKIIFFIALGAFILFCLVTSNSLPDTIEDVTRNSDSVAAYAITLFGIGLAGYSIFAGLTDKNLQLNLSQVTEDKTGLNYLQYTHCLFLKILVQALKVLILTFLIKVIISAAFIDLIIYHLSMDRESLVVWASCLNAAMLSMYIYLLLLSKSFIYNVYHCIMINVRWYAETKGDE